MTPAQRRAWRTDVFGHPDLSLAEKLTLLALETYADWPDGTNARPGVENLARMCGLKTRVVEKALAQGRQLKLIDQTSRANPKRGHAASYCLLSTRTTVRIETDSTRTTVRIDTPTNANFNPHESAFLPARNEVSTRTPVQPTNPEHQSSNTEGGGASEHEPSGVQRVPDQRDDRLPQTGNGNGNSNAPSPPSPYCARHPQGTPANCAACGAARKEREAWDQEQAVRIDAERAAIRAEIHACPECDQNGLTEPEEGPTRRCTLHRQLADLPAVRKAS